MNLLVKWLISAVSIYFAAWLIPGIIVPDFWTAMWVAAILGLLNVFIKPFLQLISLPLIVITFGIFLVVINAVLLKFTGDVIEGFQVVDFWSAFWGSLVISLVSYLLDPPGRNGGHGGGTHIHFERRNFNDPNDPNNPNNQNF